MFKLPRIQTQPAVLLCGAAVIIGAITAANAAPDISPKPKAFVYTELQISTNFDQVPWQRINQAIKRQPGFINKTWLAGVGNHSAGGFYAFDSIQHAQQFVNHYFTDEAREFGVAETTRVFDADATEAASIDMNSMHYDGKITGEPGAFVYTELQMRAQPFDTAMAWKTLDESLKQQPGLMAKTWLSGVNTATPGGFYAFDTVENAQKFAIESFPARAEKLNVALYTRVFDAKETEMASRAMNSPFYESR